MATIRAVEMALRDASLARRFEGPLHVSLGQEGAAVGIMAALSERDVILSNHRGHGHALAFGLDPCRVVAEIVGSPRGYAEGLGGSMHIFSMSEGFLGTNGIVGDPAALATGAALTQQVRMSDAVAVAVVGDGAMATGVVYEAMNLAVLWRLPFVLVCENNGYAEMTPTETHLSSPPHERALAVGLESTVADGTDVEEVKARLTSAVAAARAGRPSFVEVRTFRWTGHYVGDPRQYRPGLDEETWRAAHDPIRALAAKLGVSPETLADLEADLGRRALRLVDEVLAHDATMPPAE